MKKFLKRVLYIFGGLIVFLLILGWLVRPKEPTEAEKAQKMVADSLDKFRREVQEREQDSVLRLKTAAENARVDSLVKSGGGVADTYTPPETKPDAELPKWYKRPDGCEETYTKTERGYPIYREIKSGKLFYLGPSGMGSRRIYLEVKP